MDPELRRYEHLLKKRRKKTKDEMRGIYWGRREYLEVWRMKMSGLLAISNEIVAKDK